MLRPSGMSLGVRAYELTTGGEVQCPFLLRKM